MKMSRRRLHPLTVALGFLKFVKELIGPMLVFIISFIFRKSGSDGVDSIFMWEIIAGLAFVVVATLWGWLTWYRTTYTVDDQEIKVEQGVIVRNTKYIPFERIQSIDLSEGLLHRLFGVVKVQIETAGGTKPEAVLSAVTWEEAERIKECWKKPDHISMANALEAVEDQTNRMVKRSLPVRHLLIAGATSGKFGLILAIIAPVVSQMMEFIDVEQMIASSSFLLPTFSIVLLLFFIFLLFSWFFSILATVLQYANFEVLRTDKQILMKSGLISKRQFSIPLRRIQAIRIVDGVVRGPLGYSAIYIESAGSAGGTSETQQSVLFPLMRASDVNAFLHDIIPEYAVLPHMSWEPLPSKAVWGYLLRSLIPLSIIVIPVCWFVPWGWVSSLLIPIGAALAFWRFRSAGWAFIDTHIVFRSRVLAKTTAIIPRNRIQWDAVSQSLFQRRSGLSKYKLAVASGQRFGLHGIELHTSLRFQQWARQRNITRK